VIDEAVVGVNKELIVTVTRGMFEQLNMGLFEKVVSLVEGVLESADVSIDQVDEIVFTGESSRVPKLRQMIDGLFRG
jgi:molecular chaperone DnaK (HSP70)